MLHFIIQDNWFSYDQWNTKSLQDLINFFFRYTTTDFYHAYLMVDIMCASLAEVSSWNLNVSLSIYSIHIILQVWRRCWKKLMRCNFRKSLVRANQFKHIRVLKGNLYRIEAAVNEIFCQACVLLTQWKENFSKIPEKLKKN